MACDTTRCAWCTRKAASDTTLQNMVRDKTSPPSLVGSTKARTIVAMEELVKEHVISEMGVTIELRVSTIRGPASVHILSKYVDNAMLNLFRNLVQWHKVTTPSGALDLEVVPIVLVEALERLDKEEVGRQPDGATPIGITTKHARVRVAGPVRDFVVLPFDVHRIRMVLVIEG